MFAVGEHNTTTHPIQSPLLLSVQVLNYGQAIFEGMKAQRSAKDRIVLFR
jgi:branched-subunit amino acid aminotransferase/4-amino-4-deoxychorismate lyase